VVAIEAAVDVADHIIASQGLRTAQTLADSFTSLAEAGSLAPALARSLEDAARFRNLLVHRYAEIDDDRVIEVIRTRMGELLDYCQAIAQLLARE
jgi:uncharacterized protein YutE (UPF0331/DUF86 family)